MAVAESQATIALTYFDNNTGDASYDPLGRGLADMLITDLTQLLSLRIVERSRLNEILSELELVAAARGKLDRRVARGRTRMSAPRSDIRLSHASLAPQS
jgi:curli biogenesis system outer membrane secretion channel CsgG